VIQYNSTEENNYLENGFLANNIKDELPAAPGSRVYVTKQVSDVTQQVLNGVQQDSSGEERYQVIENNRKALIAECEKDAGHRCQVSSFFGGAQYKLNKRLEIKDVRLAYAPADAIGLYGGDADNWLWPRHTGDFAFYRAYVSPEGNSAEFAEDNVPYRPEHSLKVSATGVEEGDFVMVAGYPGRTSRYARLAEVENVFEWTYPTWVEVLEDWIAAINSASAEGSDARIKYASRLAGLNNFMKNLGGQIRGAKRAGLVERRAERETELNNWIAKSAASEGYAPAIIALDELSQESAQASKTTYWYTNVTRPQLLSAARRIYRLSKENQKPDAERESGYQERDMSFFKEGLQAIERRYDPVVDKAEWLLFIDGYLAQPKQEKAEKDREGRFATSEPKYMQAIISWQKSQGLTAYPDANSNLRITYGNVMGGSPKDGLRYTSFTTLEGIAEKDTGEAPFNAPKAQLDLIEKGDYGKYELKSLGSVPVNFMTDLDITGGNSGSATLNGKGELIGLIFDGTIESVNSDWDFNDRITRSIHVDSRYMLWVMEKLDGADHIVKEMDVINR